MGFVHLLEDYRLLWRSRKRPNCVVGICKDGDDFPDPYLASCMLRGDCRPS
jgi:hypothetical protein